MDRMDGRLRRCAFFGSALALACSPVAAGDFLEYSLVRTESGAYVKYELFGNYSGATDTVLNAFHITLDSGTTTFYHTDALNGGVIGSAVGTWNPQFVLVPGAMDSYVCIGGGEGFASGNSTAADPDWGAAGFNTAQIPYGNFTAGPGWFNQNPPNFQGRVNANGQVKLGQFVIALADEANAATIFVKNGFNNGVGGGVQFGQATFVLGAPDCNGNGIPDTDDIDLDPTLDCDSSGAIDTCQIAANPALDCDSNGTLDSCELASDPALDCDANGRIDGCDIADAPAADCDASGILDSCELVADPALDCNANGRIDGCEIADAPAADCDASGILDSCELVADPALDCDANGRIDGCDIADNPSIDCEENGVPDSCEYIDCNGNGNHDGCDIASGSAFDCDSNGVPDSCDSADPAVDCDGDGTPDACEGAVGFREDSGLLAPFGSGFPASVLFGGLLPTYQDTVTVVIEASADLNLSSEFVALNLDGGATQFLFVNGANDCPATPDRLDLVLPRAEFNALVADGELRVNLSASGAVNAAQCPDGGIRVRLAYLGLPPESDCNANGVLDACEIGTGLEPDCNANGRPDSCDIASGIDADCNANGLPDSCDIASGTETDLDGDLLPDSCDLVVGGTGFADLQSAVDAAAAGDTILVVAGKYEPVRIAGRAVSLVAIGGTASIRGNSVERGIEIIGPYEGTVSIEGFEVTGGLAGAGSAMQVASGTVEVRDCVFSANSYILGNGGAVRCLASVATFTACAFRNNEALSGGALSIEGNAAAGHSTTLVDCEFTGNSARAYGGAIVALGPLAMSGCIVEDNTAQGLTGIPSAALHVFLPEGVTVGDSRFCRNSPANIAGPFADLGGNLFSQDCDGDGLCDADEIASGAEPDCNANGFPDSCDISGGGSGDCNGNGRPDECDIADGLEPDCNGNGVPDACDLVSGTALDCNANGVPDSCDVANGTSNDIDSNGIPDECKPDCDGDGLPDAWELLQGLEEDCDGNGEIDRCDVVVDPSVDCDGNARIDSCELTEDPTLDCDLNGRLDFCDLAFDPATDCDANGEIDACELAAGTGLDCDGNGVIDSCDVAGGAEDDNTNAVPDSCELARGDLDLDGLVGASDLSFILVFWGIADAPIGDLDGSGLIDAGDIAVILSNWGSTP